MKDTRPDVAEGLLHDDAPRSCNHQGASLPALAGEGMPRAGYSEEHVESSTADLSEDELLAWAQRVSPEIGAKLWRVLNARTEVSTLVMRQVRAEIAAKVPINPVPVEYRGGHYREEEL